MKLTDPNCSHFPLLSKIPSVTFLESILYCPKGLWDIGGKEFWIFFINEWSGWLMFSSNGSYVNIKK